MPFVLIIWLFLVECIPTHLLNLTTKNVVTIEFIQLQTFAEAFWWRQILTSFLCFLSLLYYLFSYSTNLLFSIWEYSLLNPNSSKTGKKKPQPNDAVHPNKADFIRSKYQNLTFVYKPAKEDILISESDLSKQLHSRYCKIFFFFEKNWKWV